MVGNRSRVRLRHGGGKFEIRCKIDGWGIYKGMDRAAIFTELTKRNALRKMTKLPLLDLRTELAFAVEREAQRDYDEHIKQYEDDRRRINEDILSELRRTRGPDFPSSSVGRLLVELMSDQRFQAFLEIEHRIRKPIRSGRHSIIYGVHRNPRNDHR
jgi:hypothetical protein